MPFYVWYGLGLLTGTGLGFVLANLLATVFGSDDRWLP